MGQAGASQKQFITVIAHTMLLRSHCLRYVLTEVARQVHMLRSKYQEALSVAQEASQLFKAEGYARNQACCKVNQYHFQVISVDL